VTDLKTNQFSPPSNRQVYVGIRHLIMKRFFQ